MTTTDHGRGQAELTPVEARYVAAQASPEFQDLRRRYRSFVLPVAAASLGWYFFYVLLTTYAPGFMSEKLIGNINVGLVMGLLQFASTFAVTGWYVRHADNVLDPASERIRREFEEGAL